MSGLSAPIRALWLGPWADNPEGAMSVDHYMSPVSIPWIGERFEEMAKYALALDGGDDEVFADDIEIMRLYVKGIGEFGDHLTAIAAGNPTKFKGSSPDQLVGRVFASDLWAGREQAKKDRVKREADAKSNNAGPNKNGPGKGPRPMSNRTMKSNVSFDSGMASQFSGGANDDSKWGAGLGELTGKMFRTRATTAPTILKGAWTNPATEEPDVPTLHDAVHTVTDDALLVVANLVSQLALADRTTVTPVDQLGVISNLLDDMTPTEQLGMQKALAVLSASVSPADEAQLESEPGRFREVLGEFWDHLFNRIKVWDYRENNPAANILDATLNIPTLHEFLDQLTDYTRNPFSQFMAMNNRMLKQAAGGLELVPTLWNVEENVSTLIDALEHLTYQVPLDRKAGIMRKPVRNMMLEELEAARKTMADLIEEGATVVVKLIDPDTGKEVTQEGSPIKIANAMNTTQVTLGKIMGKMEKILGPFADILYEPALTREPAVADMLDDIWKTVTFQPPTEQPGPTSSERAEAKNEVQAALQKLRDRAAAAGARVKKTAEQAAEAAKKAAQDATDVASNAAGGNLPEPPKPPPLPTGGLPKPKNLGGGAKDKSGQENLAKNMFSELLGGAKNLKKTDGPNINRNSAAGLTGMALALHEMKKNGLKSKSKANKGSGGRNSFLANLEATLGIKADLSTYLDLEPTVEAKAAIKDFAEKLETAFSGATGLNMMQSMSMSSYRRIFEEFLVDNEAIVANDIRDIMAFARKLGLDANTKA